MEYRPVRSAILLGLAAAALWTAAGARAAEPDPAAVQRTLSSQLRLARGLIGTLAAKRQGENVIVSPASAAGMVAAADLGAGPAMHAGILKMLGIVPGPAAEADLAALRDAAARTAQGDELTTATRLVFDRALHPSAAGLARLAAAGVEGEATDLHAPDAATDINAWVSRATRGKISSIVDEIDPSGGMIAVNALYFSGRWENPFKASQTRPADFTAASGRRVRAPFMHVMPMPLLVRQDERFVAVGLPFQGGRFRLVALTTRGAPGEASDFADHLGWLDGRGFVESPAAVDLPRFEVKTRQSLLPALSAMGLDGTKPFTGFAKDGVVLSSVLQAVDLSVDEQGAEVAVATVGGFELQSGVVFRDVLDVTFDKPFAFALQDARTGVVLAAGFIGALDGSAVAEGAPPVPAASPFVVGPAQAAAMDRKAEEARRRFGAPAPRPEPQPDADAFEKRLRLLRDF